MTRVGFLSTTVLLMTVTLSPQMVTAGEVLAGVARETFVLPQKLPLAGYSRRKGAASQGVHDPVGVRALVLREAGTTAALVSCDLLIVDDTLFEAVRQRLIAHGLPKDVVLMVAATHTHSGPGAYGTRFLEKVSMGHFDPVVFDAIVSQITQAVLEAQASLVPVRVTFRSTTTSGLVTNRMDPQGMTDNELTVCVFYRVADHQPLGVLVGFAAHPTALGAWNRQLSADYPGVIEREVERRVPTATCLFFAGAVGDQAPVKEGSGFASAEGLGHELARRAVALLEADATAQPPSALRASQEHMPLPSARVRLGWLTLPRWLGRQFVDHEATLSLIAVGDAVFLGVPCDLAASLGERLKHAARAEGFHPMIIGFADDYIGYCIPAASYRSKAYEAHMAFNGPTTGELVVKRLTEMVHEISDTRQGTGHQ